MIKPPQCSENKVLVSLSSVHKEGTISWMNMKSPPPILRVICRGLESSERSSSFHVFVPSSPCSHSGLNETFLSIHPPVTAAKDAAKLGGAPASP